MPNFAAALREEVIRLARKELRTETAGLKKAVGRYRSEIATLKKRLSAVEQQLSRRHRVRRPRFFWTRIWGKTVSRERGLKC